MKVYTKKGDSGTTGLLGGTRVKKHHVKIESYGTVDELNAYIGLLRDGINSDKYTEILVEIQDRLFVIGSHLANDAEKSNFKLPELHAKDVEFLEGLIDGMEETLPEMKHFVLPGGHVVVSYCHIARTVCRRAERNTTALAELETVDPLILTYLNRLSDYLFVLGRKLTQELKAVETPWIPR